jgi:hypothetical protein
VDDLVAAIRGSETLLDVRNSEEGVHFGGATALDDGDRVAGCRVFDERSASWGDDQR